MIDQIFHMPKECGKISPVFELQLGACAEKFVTQLEDAYYFLVFITNWAHEFVFGVATGAR